MWLGRCRGDGGDGLCSDSGVKGTGEGMERAPEWSGARGSVPCQWQARVGAPGKELREKVGPFYGAVPPQEEVTPARGG